MNNTYNPTNLADKLPEHQLPKRDDPEYRALMQRMEPRIASVLMIDEVVSKVDGKVSRDVLAEFADKQVQVQADGVSMKPTEVAPNAALPVEELAQSALSMSQVQTPEVSSAQAQVAEAYAPISISQFVIDHPRVDPLAAIGYEQIDNSLDDELAA